MSEKENIFLRRCIGHEGTPESRLLEQKLIQQARNTYCVGRALRLMGFLAGLAAIGLGCAAIYLNNFPNGLSQFLPQFVVRAFCTLGAGSLLSMLAFAGLAIFYQSEAEELQEQGWRLVLRMIEARAESASNSGSEIEGDKSFRIVRENADPRLSGQPINQPRSFAQNRNS